MSNLKPLWSITQPLTKVSDVAELVSKQLSTDKDFFSLSLAGDLGAGKTTFAARLLYSLGLNTTTPVTSPTYTYMNEYQIKTRWFLHMDLYRVERKVGLEEYGISLQREYDGLILEWADNVAWTPELAPTHKLLIEHLESGDRSYSLFKQS